MVKLRKVSASLCAAALLIPVLASQAHGATATEPARPGPVHARAATELLDVNYESGTLNSGLACLTTTHATAPDASSVAQPGHASAYAIEHKVTLDDPGYVSNGAPRSESATDLCKNGQFTVGDTQRYEFSVLLKDWQPYAPGDSETGDIIFQGKYAGGNPPAFYLMTKRNAIAFRSPHLNQQTTVVPDFRPYINAWMNFRVDARWTTDSTGYFTVSVQLPGACGYVPAASYQNVVTYQPENPADHGYLKWGLYRPSESLAAGDVPTRIVEHDDIRIFDLP
ncbi:heparin lyase I family protein [Streptomyces sp. NPDC020917]|uniref:heparin lyase I family protein n=1 Tax=Streptomyces sp. NPDC020917 TaxID=3365102 RepID=UPI0037AF4160